MSSLLIAAAAGLGLLLLWAQPVSAPASQRRAVRPVAGVPPAQPPAAPSSQRAVSSLDVARLMERLAAALRTGAAPPEAWRAVAASLEAGPLHQLAERMARGADPTALTVQEATDRIPSLGSLRAALLICARTGAPTASVLHSIAATLRDLHDASLARASAFAGPRATGRILLLLPLAGIALGMVIGVNPIAVLTTTPTGLVMLITGTALTAAGWWWMHRLIRRAAGHPPAVDPSIVLELVAAPLLAGSPLADALRAVGETLEERSLDPALGRTLVDCAQALSAGVPVAAATDPLPRSLRPLREAAILAETSGADLADALRAAGKDLRRGAARAAEAEASRLGVALVLPTGLTLLPAFVALGIIPTVTSLLGAAIGTATGSG